MSGALELPLTKTDLGHLARGAVRQVQVEDCQVFVIAEDSGMWPIFKACRARWPVQVVLTGRDLEILRSGHGIELVTTDGTRQLRVIRREKNPRPEKSGMGYSNIASSREQSRLWWAIEGANPPETDDEVLAALDAQDGSPQDKAVVARAWGNPEAARRILVRAGLL